jgi:hypothetical protein
VFIFGDDILLYFLAEGGEVVDPYNSMPAYFGDEAGGLTPSGGDAERLCRAFGVPEAAEDVHAVLHSPNLGAIDAEGIEPGAFQFTFEHERHEALVLLR